MSQNPFLGGFCRSENQISNASCSRGHFLLRLLHPKHCTICPFWAQCNIYCCTLYGHGKRTPYPPPIPLVFCRRRPRKLEEPREMGLFKNKRLGVPHWHTLEFRRPDTFFSSNCHLHWNCSRIMSHF